MGFLSRLLGQDKAERNKAAAGLDAELRALCGKNSHPEYPMLRAEYSPTSRYPAVDFTPWIARKLTERRFKDIAYLLTQLTSANPGLGIGSDYWEKRALNLCNLNLQEVIECDDDKAFLDLHAALFPYILHGSLDGFMLVNHVDFLAMAMSPYAFSVHHLETKVKAANQFVKKMRRETEEHSTAWTDYQMLRIKDLISLMNSETPAVRIRAKLREVSMGARQLFFGTLKDGSGQGHWIARPYGIDESKAALELTEVGLGELQDDPALVIMTYRKGEILEALEGYPIKQGWNKKYIAKYIAENAPGVLVRLTEGKRVLALKADFSDEGGVLASWIARTKMLLAVALGFMEKSEHSSVQKGAA